MNRKSQLQSYIQKSESPLNLVEFEKLAKEIYKEMPGLSDEAQNWPKDEKQLAEKLVKDIIYKKISIYKAYRYDWETGKVLPNDEELEYLKKFSKKFSFITEFFEEEKKITPSLADDFEWAKNDVKEVKEALDQLIKSDEYRRKAEEKLKEENEKENKKKGGDNSSPSQLSEIDKQIADLQGKVQALEEKEKEIPSSDNSDTSQQQKREIQQQIQQLKNELKEKEKEKEKENKQSQQPNKGDNFPWKPIIIGGLIAGGVIVVLVIILLIKKIRT